MAHQAGTCRFGSDPATSVLNTDCRAHEVDNLYVVDTSFFPSIGAVNPALTAMANALRVGDHLLARLGVDEPRGRRCRLSAEGSRSSAAASAGWPPRRRCSKADVDITLVDRTNHHLFQPLLYQLASGHAVDGRMRGPDPRHAAQAVQRAACRWPR